MIKLSRPQERVLCALLQGATLKAHRYLDGRKVCKLHPLHGPAETIPRAVVDALKRQGLIHSNQKFPAAAYLLTEKGKTLAAALGEPTTTQPLSATNHFQT